jgi:hypothetical protein
MAQTIGIKEMTNSTYILYASLVDFSDLEESKV